MSRARELLLRVQREMIEDERFKSLICSILATVF